MVAGSAAAGDTMELAILTTVEDTTNLSTIFDSVNLCKGILVLGCTNVKELDGIDLVCLSYQMLHPLYDGLLCEPLL